MSDEGLQCPKCGCAHIPVLYTRRLPYSRKLRVRECRNCGRLLRTTEAVVGESTRAAEK